MTDALEALKTALKAESHERGTIEVHSDWQQGPMCQLAYGYNGTLCGCILRLSP